jgi:type VI secretion system protein ImpL
VRRFFLNWWTLTIAAAVVVALVLAFGLPIFVGFLRPWWVRLLLVIGVALVWAIFALVRVLTARAHADAIAEEIAQPAQPGDEEAAMLSQRMAEAMAGLKQASGDKRDYLYSRPWYMIIGPPGAGKTTALLNAGLRFPFADSALKGVGGTRNLDFWFADEAALVDTAGRYTTQDSDSAVDARSWEHFLGLLRKHRPLQPINGVLVAIGVDELLRSDLAHLDAHASAVRRRLAELRKTLEVAAPVYVLFTKTDLLAGFVEFYDDLDVEGRRAVLGATLPWGKPVAADALAGQFDELVQSIADRSAKRLQEEHDARRRGLILGFTSQVEGLRSRVLRFLEGAFIAERGVSEPLHGFYFTSGVQEGAPLDRILAGVAQVYEAPQPQAREQKGRAYFLNRLLSEVVFAEAGLVQTERTARARRSAQLTIALAAIAIVSVIVLGLWGVSFMGNRALQRNLLTGAQGAQQQIHDSGVDLVEVRATDPDLDQALPALQALRSLPGGYAEQKAHGPPLFSTFGLYQHGIADAARQSYVQALRRIFLPRILLRLETYLRQNQTQAFNEYEPLRVYLMLGGQGPMDAKAVKNWVENDWATSAFAGEDRAETRKQLASHLDALLDDPDMNSVWPGHVPPLDGGLITAARQIVQTLSLADRAYAILKEKGASAGAPWESSTVLASGDGQAFANGDAVLKLQVPYFFTRVGYEKSYLAGLTTVAEDLKKQLWVLGQDADTTAIRSQVEAVRPGVAASYARDYIAAWQAVIKALQPADYFHNAIALGAFTRTPSPLKLVLLEVAKNTTFTGGASGAAQSVLQQKLAALPGAQAIQQSQQGAVGLDAAQQISTAFQSLKTYVGDGKAPAPIDDFISAIKSAASANSAAQTANQLGGGGGAANQGQLNTALGAVATAAGGAPPDLQAFVAQAAKGGTQAATSTAQGAVATAWSTNLATPCQTLVADHYPFVAAAPADAPVADLLRVFGMGGQMDSFARDQLTPLLDASGPVWRWRTDNPVAAALDPVSAEQFHRAAQLRDLLVSGQTLQIQMLSLGADVTSAEFSSGGITYKFDATTPGPHPLNWNVNGLPEAHVTLFNKATPLPPNTFSGPWALFRLLDSAKKQNTGPTSFTATFGQGVNAATFKFILPTEQNPFSRGGLWSFRCPSAL